MPENVMARTRSREWAVQVAKHMGDARFPMDKEEAKRVLGDLQIDDTPCTKIIECMDFPIESPEKLIDEIEKHTCLTACPPEEAWTFEVADAVREADFPMSKEHVQERVRGISVGGSDISRLLEQIDYPVSSPSDLLHKLKAAAARAGP